MLTPKQISARKDYLAHREAYLLRARRRRLEKSDIVKADKQRWYQAVKNTDKFIQDRRSRDKKYRSTVKGKLHSNFSSLLRNSLTGRVKNRVAWESLVGYTTQQLKECLESKFQAGMTWDNYGFDGWHIDHIKPICSFMITNTTDQAFKECWGLSNLRPLWKLVNLSKSGQDRKFSVNLIHKL